MIAVGTLTIVGEKYEGVTLETVKYRTGELGAVLYQGWETLAYVSTSIKGSQPQEGCFWAKTWSENSGLLEQLIDLGVVELTGRSVATGFCIAPEARLIRKDDK